ncbi:MAG TPA: APC family permease [Gemmatimonadaceae bacterium]|nr:APC family permease [Gemmatimonadaceae bacterium]
MRIPLRRSLTTLSLVFVIFFNVSGGAFTTESLIISAGPGLGLLILILVPILWSIPETLIVAELGSMLPEEGGYYRWVYRAFGPFWAFQNGWLTWMYSLVDMAIYPVLFNQYLSFFFPGLDDLTQWIISLAVIWTATAVNLRGAGRVGRSSVLTGGFILGTFLLLTLAAIPNITHAPWEPFTKPGIEGIGGLGVGLSIALWNYIGWDNASTVQGEVVDATRSYPRALAIALPLIAIGYLVPLSATLGATDWTQWKEGGWPDIARMSAGSLGEVIAVCLAIAGMLSAISLFNALLLSYSRIPLAMADDGFLPTAMGQVDSRGTPRNAVLASAICYSVFAALSFAHLVVADVLLYSMALFLEFAALIAIRRNEPELRGAFRIPLGTRGVALLASLPVMVLLVVTVLELQDGEYGAPAVIAAILAAALGPLMFRVADRNRRHRVSPAL